MDVQRESNRGETKTRDSRKKPAQNNKNDNHATQDVQEDIEEGKCIAGSVLTRTQMKSDKIRPLKVKEAMSSVGKVYHRRSLEEGLYSEEML